MILFLVAILIPAAVHGKAVRAKGHGHNNHGLTTDNPLHVNNEIQDLNIHFGTHFCLDLLVVDCKTHVTTGDEQICGSDDRTYANHCEFAHAMCMFSHLTVKSHGACNSATRPPSTMMPQDTTMMPSGSSMMPTDTSMMPVDNTMDTQPTDGMTTEMSTTKSEETSMMPVDNTMDTQPTDGMTTQMMSTTTTQSQETVLFQQVFCKNKDLINCPTTVTLTCGSNGVMYNSGCEFSKAKCADIQLAQVDVSQCSTPVVG